LNFLSTTCRPPGDTVRGTELPAPLPFVTSPLVWNLENIWKLFPFLLKSEHPSFHLQPRQIHSYFIFYKFHWHFLPLLSFSLLCIQISFVHKKSHLCPIKKSHLATSVATLPVKDLLCVAIHRETTREIKALPKKSATSRSAVLVHREILALSRNRCMWFWNKTWTKQHEIKSEIGFEVRWKYYLKLGSKLVENKIWSWFEVCWKHLKLFFQSLLSKQKLLGVVTIRPSQPKKISFQTCSVHTVSSRCHTTSLVMEWSVDFVFMMPVCGRHT